MKITALLILCVSLVFPAAAYAVKKNKDRSVEFTLKSHEAFFEHNPSLAPGGDYLSEPDLDGQQFWNNMFLISCRCCIGGTILALSLFWFGESRLLKGHEQFARGESPHTQEDCRAGDQGV